MSLSIWKFPLTIADMQLVQMPVGARILTCQMQFNIPCLWAVVDPSADKQQVEIHIVGTGHPLASEFAKTLQYIATFQQGNGMLVWHVFQRRMSEPVAPAIAEVREEVCA